jgi:hypothetical protein
VTLQQHGQDFGRLLLEPYPPPILAQLIGTQIELKRAEARDFPGALHVNDFLKVIRTQL